MVKNILLLSLLSAIIVLFYLGLQKKEFSNHKQARKSVLSDKEGFTSLSSNKCTFKPKGKTKSECNDLCKESDTNCTASKCNKICNECHDTDCIWVTNSLKPHQPKINVKPLVNGLRVSWQRPKTEYKIIKYTIVLQKTTDNEQKTFYFPVNKGSVDVSYDIVELNPEETFIVYAIATNRFGNSPNSNKNIVKPLKKSLHPDDKSEEKPVHELNFQRGEYEAEDLNEVLEKVIESKRIKEPIHITARY